MTPTVRISISDPLLSLESLTAVRPCAGILVDLVHPLRHGGHIGTVRASLRGGTEPRPMNVPLLASSSHETGFHDLARSLLMAVDVRRGRQTGPSGRGGFP